MARRALFACLIALFLSSCGDDGTGNGDTGPQPDAGGDADAQPDLNVDLPPGNARWTRPPGSASIVFRVDDAANRTYSNGQMEWNGSFSYDAATNIVEAADSWLPDEGPFAPLYDDGSYLEGGHEAEEGVAGDDIYSAEVFFLADEATTFDYGLINELDEWIWSGPTGRVSIDAGETGRVTAQGLVIPAFGNIDLKVTLDTSALHAEFSDFDAGSDTLHLTGSVISWSVVEMSDDGDDGDVAAGDGVYTFTLSSHRGPHDGLLRLEHEALFAVIFGGPDGDEYRVGATALTNGLTASSTWGGDFQSEELLLRSGNREQALYTAVVIGPDEDPSPDPELRFVDPDRGPTTGNTPVELRGDFFQPGASVTFDDLAADCSRQSEAIITCSTPPHPTAGVIAVEVTNRDGGSDVHQLGYTYIDVSTAPRVTSTDPASGTELGGTDVTIGGANFVDGAAVLFGDQMAESVTFDGAEQLTVAAPAGAPGSVDVSVRNPDSQQGVLRNGFTYLREGVDYAAIQWPTATVVGRTGEVLPAFYGRVYEPGVTDAEGQGGGMTAELLIGPDNTDPSDDFTGWTAYSMEYNGDLGNDDEYVADDAVVIGGGTLDWAVRFSLDGGSTWLYGDLDGSLNGYDPLQAGSLVITTVEGLVLDAVEPPAISLLGVQQMSLLGLSFTEATNIETRPSGFGDFTTVTSSFESAEEIGLTFADPGASGRLTGDYDLRLTDGEDTLVVAKAYLVGYVHTPILDGAIQLGGDDWPLPFERTGADETSNWTGNNLFALYTAFDDDGLYLGVLGDLQRQGDETDPGNVLVVYLDTDFGTGRGFADMSQIADEDLEVPPDFWRLDRALTSNIDATAVEGFGADFAFGTFELEPAIPPNFEYLDALTGWRQLRTGDNAWFPLDAECSADGPCVAGQAGDGEVPGTLETFVSWQTLYGQAGPPAGGRRLAMFARIVNRNGDFISNQSLPSEIEDEDPWNVTDVTVLDVR